MCPRVCVRVLLRGTQRRHAIDGLYTIGASVVCPDDTLQQLTAMELAVKHATRARGTEMLRVMFDECRVDSHRRMYDELMRAAVRYRRAAVLTWVLDYLAVHPSLDPTTARE